MKSVLISIQPKWCELIASGEKTLEVRKTKPKMKMPFKCYIYCTKSNDMLWVLNTISRMEYGFSAVCANLKDTEGACTGNGKVIGEFVCDTFVADNTFGHDALFNGAACMSEADASAYSLGLQMYGWHISNLVIYEKPKKLSDFKKCNHTCYYDHLGLATPKCKDCKECQVDRPPQSWCYVETLE